jgi:hypothetical protein
MWEDFSLYKYVHASKANYITHLAIDKYLIFVGFKNLQNNVHYSKLGLNIIFVPVSL